MKRSDDDTDVLSYGADLFRESFLWQKTVTMDAQSYELIA